MPQGIMEKEIASFIKDWEEACGEKLNEKTALKRMKEIKEYDLFQQEVQDFNHQMQQAEDAMWREGVLGNIKNGVKPLAVF